MSRPGRSAIELEPRHVAALRRALLGWYAEHRRPLPWRATRDPYAIWVSEAMLQQTRVEAVEPYWRRFLARLPTLRALAAADEETVLALWSGLGYYRRARALREAAQAIVARHGGEFPRERESLLALPGVGPYTAGAVLSIAFDQPEPLVDGNVERVLARAFALDGDLSRAAPKRALWARAAALVPREGGAGDWNQALMELGATLCTPRSPRCSGCPWSGLCAAREQGRTDELPRARPRPEPLDVRLELAWIERGGRLLLERRPPGGRMAGLWQPPTIEVPGPGGGLTGLFPPAWPAGARIEIGAALGQVRHGITRHRILARVLAGRLRGPLAGRGGALEWIPRARVADLGLTGMARKVLRAPFAAPLAARQRAPLG
jgi:A/G-specific adenine glycosylase